jgi:hypothetical protein
VKAFRQARAVGMAGLALMAALALSASAQAAGPSPTVTTGGTLNLSFASVTLTGTINPNGSNTSYFFQYGTTTQYGTLTPVADAGAGSKSVGVSVGVTGLQPVTQYHYRLIAVNSGGSIVGRDRTFFTTAIPLSLQILAAPNPVPFGGTATVEGTLSGTGNAGLAVVLQANPFPYTAGFTNVGNPQLTSATGGFAFPVLGLAQATQFRVVTTTAVPPVISPVFQEGVTVLVSAHVARTHRRGFARIFGTVTPAQDGTEVAIETVRHGRYVLVAGTGLRHLSASSSRFSSVVRATRGVYRVLVLAKDGAHSSSYSSPLRIG